MVQGCLLKFHRSYTDPDIRGALSYLFQKILKNWGKNQRSTPQVSSYYPKQKFQDLTITIPSKWLDNLPNAVFVCPPFLLNSTAEGGEIKIL